MYLVSNNLGEAKADILKLEKHLEFFTDQYKEYTQYFIDYKNQHRIKGEQADIYYWLKRSPSELMKFIDDLTDTISTNQMKKGLKGTGLRLVTQNDDWVVYFIITHDACRKYGKNTKWCITEATSYYWNYYRRNGYHFYFFIRKNPLGDEFDKLAAQCTDKKIHAFWDSIDVSHKPLELKHLNLPSIRDDLRTLNSKVKLDSGLYLTSYNQLEVIPEKVDGNIVLPKEVLNIPAEAFLGSDLKSLSMNDCKYIKTLRPKSFMYCDNLTDLDLPNNIQTIGYEAFRGCSDLTDITLPHALTVIQDKSFEDCTQLKSVKIPNNVEELGDEVFKNCTNLESVYLPKNLTNIGDNVFKGCHNLTITTPLNSPAYRYAVANNINVLSA